MKIHENQKKNFGFSARGQSVDSKRNHTKPYETKRNRANVKRNGHETIPKHYETEEKRLRNNDGPVCEYIIFNTANGDFLVSYKIPLEVVVSWTVS